MKTLFVVFGTRPEAIKMCPLVLELKKQTCFKTIVCTTGQHKEMLRPILELFNVVPDYDLDIMKQDQTLFDISSSTTEKLRPLIDKIQPDAIIVHGDTTTAFATTLVGYYLRIPVIHVEAGLRTNDSFSPYPEEFNRCAIDKISSICFAPTNKAYANLIQEGKDPESCYNVGNTAIDALKYTSNGNIDKNIEDKIKGKRLITLTAHRRESFDGGLESIFKSIVEITQKYDDVVVVYPMHKNPNVRKHAYDILTNNDRIILCEPLDVLSFHSLMKKSYLTLTDSGGIQEEAPSLGCPVVVLRDKTERMEAIEAGTVVLAGTDTNRIISIVSNILDNNEVHDKMKNAINPYGDGMTSNKITNIIKNYFAEA
ncbi:MAG: UDP-N-acetylglucosamine 2-epimerase (non-hydrolyzing) [Clostridia bacterium]|nr:UDP-N-acetylglucosamine 2-epimerase (non-hydrolyzing) [Clostridia bacterium]